MEATLSEMKNIVASILWGGVMGLLFLFSACSSDEEHSLGNDPQAVQFNGTTALATPQTRVLGTAWINGDQVGIYMLKSGVVEDNAANRQYTTDAMGKFTPMGQAIYYPQDGSEVDFVAYHPYKSTLTNNTYKVDVSDQSDAAKIDLLYSYNATGKSKSSGNVTMNFAHRLTKLTIKTKEGWGLQVSDLAGLGVTISGMPTTADFNLLTNAISNENAPADISPKTITGEKEYSAILIPQKNQAGSKVSFAVASIGTFEWDLSAIDFAAGNHYTYTITINRTGVTVLASNITEWTGINSLESGEITLPPIETVLIKAGTFQMGTTGNIVNEKPHKVTLTQGFRISKYQVTSAQYAVFLNAVGVGEDRKASVQGFEEHVLFDLDTSWNVKWENNQWVAIRNDNVPMIKVSWYGAKAFADWLGGSLPTEAQWEYACRAGTSTVYSFGDDAGKLGDYAWYSDNTSSLVGVGTKLPNPWGLYDMHGNVFEWCSDWYNADYGISGINSTDTYNDPIGATAGNYRVLRGGSWDGGAQYCRSAYRSYSYPYFRNSNVGFRVVLP